VVDAEDRSGDALHGRQRAVPEDAHELLADDDVVGQSPTNRMIPLDARPKARHLPGGNVGLEAEDHLDPGERDPDLPERAHLFHGGLPRSGRSARDFHSAASPKVRVKNVFSRPAAIRPYRDAGPVSAGTGVARELLDSCVHGCFNHTGQ